MISINETLIRNVFKQLIICKHSLNAFLMVEDDEEETDHRVLGDLIIKNLPWPISVELRRLFSGSMRQLDRQRLDQIFKTLERTMQFIGFMMLSQLWQEKNRRNVLIPKEFLNEFESRITVLSMGNYSWLIRSLVNIFKENNIVWFTPEIEKNFDKKFLAALDFWIPERNEIGHYQINLNSEEIEKRCVEYEEKLTFILEKIAFLSVYKLVSVRDIRVIKPKKQEARFHHTIDLLNSSDSDFKAKEIDEVKFSESNSVLLMKTLKTMDEYLNLSPLIIDTNSEVIDTKEKFALKKDIFMFTKFRNDNLFYIGTEVTEKCDLKLLSNYNQLLNEFKEMLHDIMN